MRSSYSYSSEFFDYIESGARRSARRVVALLMRVLHPKGVLDVGCGRGAWLDEWSKIGVGDVVGADGDYVDRQRLSISPERFHALDLSKDFDLGRRFDLVESLEVGEHIAEPYADTLVRNLCRHGETILFSAAVPGQGGETHVNEQPIDYWRFKFQSLGYGAYDFVRPAILPFADIEPWYRYNSLLYVSENAARRLPKEVLETRLAPGARVPNLAPLSWRARNVVLRCLPQASVHQLAIIKHKLYRRFQTVA